MKQLLTLVFLLVTFQVISAQEAEKSKHAILNVMHAQELAWNSGNIEGFMEGYWQSDSLKFVGASGITYGWKQTLDHYKTHYPDLATMGKLTFTILTVDLVSSRSAFVIGKWKLTRKDDEPGGYFTLLWKLMKGKWVIVVDHTSAASSQ
jgi:hypothetical protein